MRHVSYRTMIDRGRKAGLRTAELYQALTGQRPEAGVNPSAESDSNGFVSVIDQLGQRVYLPSAGRRR
jgi:hypothetical protein